MIRQGMLIKTKRHCDYILQLPDDKGNTMFYLYYRGLRKSDCSTSFSVLLCGGPSKIILLYAFFYPYSRFVRCHSQPLT